MESNPEVWNAFLQSLGVPLNIQFTDVFGLDPELLAMVPGKPLAALLLFPISENTEKLSTEKQAETTSVSEDVFFMKQTVGNACEQARRKTVATIALQDDPDGERRRTESEGTPINRESQSAGQHPKELWLNPNGPSARKDVEALFPDEVRRQSQRVSVSRMCFLTAPSPPFTIQTTSEKPV